MLAVGAGGGLDPNNIAIHPVSANAPGKRAVGVYVWRLNRGCTGTAKWIARGALEPDCAR